MSDKIWIGARWTKDGKFRMFTIPHGEYWDRLDKIRKEYERKKLDGFGNLFDWATPTEYETVGGVIDKVCCAYCSDNDPLPVKSNFDEYENTFFEAQKLADIFNYPAYWEEERDCVNSLLFDECTEEPVIGSTEDMLESAVALLSIVSGLPRKAVMDDIRSFSTGRLRNCQLWQMFKRR